MSKKLPNLSGWNYRVVKEVDNFSIREVYYDENNRPHSWTSDANFLWTEKPEDLKAILVMMLKSFEKPVLEVRIKNSGEAYLKEI